MTKKSLLKEVAQNKFQALSIQLEALLIEKKRDDLAGELAQLVGQHHLYEQHLLEGTHTDQELNREAARLRKSFVLFIDKVFAIQSRATKTRSRQRWLWVGLLLVSGLLILIGNMKWPSIEFVLEGETSFVAFRADQLTPLEDDLALEDFFSHTLKSVRLDGLNFQVEGGASLDEVAIFGGKLRLEKLDIPAGTTVNYDIADGQINGQLFVDSIQCLISLKGAELELVNQGIMETIGNDSTLVTADLILAQNPQFSFTLSSEDRIFQYRLLPVSGLQFQRRSTDEIGGLESALQSGAITTRDIKFDLDNNLYVNFIDPKSTTLSLLQSGANFQIRVEGMAKNVTIGGRPDRQKSIKSTVAEHLGKNDQANRILNWLAGLIAALSTFLGLGQEFKKFNP